MNERYLRISNDKLSLPENCLSPDVIAIIYLLPPNIGITDVESINIMAVKCRQSHCSVNNCRYQNETSL